MRLVRVSREFPPELNPFVRQNVVIKAAGVPGEAPHSKWIVAREGILDGIRHGFITPGMKKVVEATSGNTGNGMGIMCNILGIPFVAMMSGDAPQEKINAIRTLGRGTSLQLLFDSEETTVACARRLGRQDGWYNPCQYDGIWNPLAHFQYHAPQLWAAQGDMALLFVPGGTMGTPIGLSMYAREKGHRTKVIPVLCAEGQEVPGVRTLSSINEDVRQPWKEFFREEDLQFGSRHAAFYLSFLTWPHVPQMLGPSFGLAFTGALKFLRKHRNSGTLDQFRGNDGKIQVIIFGPDDYKPYMALYMGVLNRKTELSAKTMPNLMHIID